MSEYVIIKFANAEQVMATVVEQKRSSIVVKDVITVKSVPIMGKTGDVTERVLTTKFCNYSDENEFELDFENMIYCKPLKESIHKHYRQVVKEFNEEDPMKLDGDQEESTELDIKSILH